MLYLFSSTLALSLMWKSLGMAWRARGAEMPSVYVAPLTPVRMGIGTFANHSGWYDALHYGALSAVLG